MNASERWELQASEALDGEIDRDELVELLDAMADQPDCRRFWREARQLQAVAESIAGPVSGPIADSPAVRSPAPRPRRNWAAAAVAAAIALGVGLTLVFGLGGPAPAGAEVDVVLEEDAGAMSDDRFVALTLELLRSDRRYQRRMLQILDQVGADRVVEEGGAPLARDEREYRLTQHQPNTAPEFRSEAGKARHVY